MVKRGAWLSITPEPERELPWAIATLRHRRSPEQRELRSEEARIERLILRASQRQWLRYLHEAVELIERSPDETDPQLVRARETALSVLANHHNLLLGIPGRGGELAAADRARLGRLTNHH